MLSALSNGARHRILIKGGTPLEKMIGLKAVVMDKTGTITTGVPRVVRIETIDSVDRNHTLSILYTLEKQSDHPLAKAIADHLSKEIDILDIETNEISGRGMESTISDKSWQIGRLIIRFTHPYRKN